MLHSPFLPYIWLSSAKFLWAMLKFSPFFLHLFTTTMMVTTDNSVSMRATTPAMITPTIKLGKGGESVMKLSLVVTASSVIILILLGVLDPILSGRVTCSSGICSRLLSSPFVEGGVGCVVTAEGSEGQGNVTARKEKWQ